MFYKIYESFKTYIKENWKFLIFLVLFLSFFSIDTNYSIFKPGGTIDISERISGKDIYESKGSFNMAYVGMVKGKLPYYLLSLVLPDWELVKNEDIIYNNEETITDTLKRDKIYYNQAIINAQLVAFNYANIKYTKENEKNYAIYVTEENNSDLIIGDEILSYDEYEFIDLTSIIEYIQTKEINEVIKIKYLRDNKEYITYATIYEEDNNKLIGLSVIKLFDINSEYNIKLESKKGESGPSGGLMLSLAIYDAITSEDITNGKTIVGTGTIDEEGIVGEIGSVKYKLAAAIKEKADIFICPKSNYDEAINYAKSKKYDIIIYGVESFEEALNSLKGQGRN